MPYQATLQGRTVNCHIEADAAAIRVADRALAGERASSKELWNSMAVLQSYGLTESAEALERLQLQSLAAEYRASCLPREAD